MPNWTKEQSDAIYESGQNIIVSAGAGSGKTAVLSERVLQKVLSGTDIDRLLVLTFTKAAANEMKERIRKKIKKEPHLVSQLNKIDSSYITTFDSFSLSLVKKYHHLINVTKNINIVDSNILNIKTEQFLDEIMEYEYEKKETDFVKFINDFCGKDDYEIKRMILNVNAKLDLKYDKENYLKNYLDSFYQNDFIKEKIKTYYNFLENKIKLINDYLTQLSNEVDLSFFSRLNELLSPLLESKEYHEIKINLSNIERLPNLPKGSSDYAKNIKTLISDEIKNLRELTRYDDLEKTIMETKDYVKAIKRIIEKLDSRVNAFKFQNDLYDFVDISKMAIKILQENPDIQKEMQDYFKEILIDEYQDTSDLQETFIRLISNNNLYMVGDVKQSIYRFRNANPYIFREKYNNYSQKNGGLKIDLLKNFRSRKEVLENINLMFNFLMDDFIGGANYQVEHQMVFGNNTYLEEGLTNQNYNFEVYDYPYDKDSSFKQEEIEAFIIANDILDKVKNHYQVFDKDQKVLRDITFNDFAILMDRSTNFELYSKIFLYKQIPLSIYKDEYLTNSSLFLVIKNIFRLLFFMYEKINSKESEYTFLAIGRSFLFDYNDSDLFDIIQKNDYHNTLIFQKLEKILINLPSKSISMILDEIMEEFDVYNRLRKIKDLENNYVQIDYLYTLASNLNIMGYNLKDFDDYLEEIFSKEADIRFSVNRESSNSVKMMTIHKSKGLEYHLCYFPGLTKKFNKTDIKDSILYDQEFGIITPYFDDGLDNNFYLSLAKEKYNIENISEEIRLFYVALTRAKEKMIFVMPHKDIIDNEINDLIDNNIRLNYQSFADILLSLYSIIKDYFKTIDLKKLSLTKDYSLVNNTNLWDTFTKTKEKILLIDYPKYSKESIDNIHFSKDSRKLYTKEEKDKMSFGEEMHYYLETLDLDNPSLETIPVKFRDTIKHFLDSELFKKEGRIKYYQEYEFIYQEDKKTKHGVIDLLVEYKEYYNIIDYKLKNIDDPLYRRQLKGYQEYLSLISHKPVNLYLYSIMDAKYEKV